MKLFLMFCLQKVFLNGVEMIAVFKFSQNSFKYLKYSPKKVGYTLLCRNKFSHLTLISYLIRYSFLIFQK